MSLTLVNPFTMQTVWQQKRVTLRDVAQAAGVSIATCSYALSGRTDRDRPLPAATRAKVAAAAQQLGYAGNPAARLLRRQRTELIALVYAPPVGPWLDRLTMQCEDVAVDHGYSVIGVPIRHRERAEHSLRVITRGYVDGVIFTTEFVDDLDLAQFSQHTRAMVAFSEQAPPAYGDMIRNHIRSAVAEATEYLLASGRRRIAFLSHGLSPDPTETERYRGYRDAFQARGLSVDPTMLRVGAAQRGDALVAVRDLLRSPDRPDALFSESDRGALAALQAARDCDLSVPEDFAVIGSGNTQEASFSSPPLTSVGMYELDFTPVIEMLFARIDDPSLAARELSLPWVLNHRESA